MSQIITKKVNNFKFLSITPNEPNFLKIIKILKTNKINNKLNIQFCLFLIYNNYTKCIQVL